MKIFQAYKKIVMSIMLLNIWKSVLDVKIPFIFSIEQLVICNDSV